MRVRPGWKTLLALLPAGADKARFAAEFDHIVMRWPGGVERERDNCLEQVHLCDQALAILPRLPVRSDLYRLIDHRTSCQARADTLERERRQWKSRRYIDLLVLAKHMGVPLGYTSGRAHGPGIDYLRAVATVLDTRLRPSTARQLVRLHFRRQEMGASMRAAGSMVTDAFVVDTEGNVRPS
jgi:hypothetical protein